MERLTQAEVQALAAAGRVKDPVVYVYQERFMIGVSADLMGTSGLQEAVLVGSRGMPKTFRTFTATHKQMHRLGMETWLCEMIDCEESTQPHPMTKEFEIAA